ncbi:YlbE-like family protein [Salibacterium sp. K-3]
MHPDCYTWIKADPEYQTFLRTHPEWYRMLGRSPEWFEDFAEEARRYYREPISTQISEWKKTTDSVIKLLKLLQSSK